MSKSVIIYVMMLLFFAITIAIGVVTSRKAKTASDYFVAGKSVGTFTLALSTFATAISGLLFIGGPGLMYNAGISAMYMTLPGCVSLAMCYLLLGKKFRLVASV